MSLRNAAIVLLSSAALAGLSGLVITACSSSTSVTDPPGDSGPGDSGKRDSGQPLDSGPVDPDAGQTRKQCLDACFAAHAKSNAAYKAVDDCWSTKCSGPCLDQTGVFDAGTGDADAGDAGPALDGGGLCGTDVGSGQDLACDQCSTAYCCAQWATCYNDPDCAAIDECAAECPAK